MFQGPAVLAGRLSLLAECADALPLAHWGPCSTFTVSPLSCWITPLNVTTPASYLLRCATSLNCSQWLRKIATNLLTDSRSPQPRAERHQLTGGRVHVESDGELRNPGFWEVPGSI